MSFVVGAGYTNCDILYSGLKSLPEEGTELYAGGFDVQLGGAPVTLINLHKLNIPVKFATFVGDSQLCGMMKQEYRCHGMDYANLYDPEKHGKMPITVTSVIITERNRTFVSYRESSGKDFVSQAELDAMLGLSKGARFAMMGCDFPELHKLQKELGTELILDMGWDDDIALEKYSDLLELADYYTPNRGEALKITGTSNVDDAIDVLSRYFPKAIVKLDSEGCLLKEGGVKALVPPLQDVAFVDATGAGDSFRSGLVYGLFHGYAFADCVKFGNIMGGTCVSAVGCLGKQLDETELLRIFERFQHTS